MFDFSHWAPAGGGIAPVRRVLGASEFIMKKKPIRKCYTELFPGFS